MTDSNGEFIIDRRKAIAGLGMAGVGVTTGLSFASDNSTSDDIEVSVDGGGVVDVATAEEASDGGLGIEYGEVATENGGGVTGFAGDKSKDVLKHPPYELGGDTDDYDDRVLYGAVLEDPGEVNQFLNFTVTIGNVGEVANGDPFDFLTLELALEQIEDDDGELNSGDAGSDNDPTLDPDVDDNDDEPSGADALGDEDEAGDGPESTETAVDVGSEDIVVGGEDDGTVTVSLTNPRARWRTRPAADFDDGDDFGGYRVVVTGGTASVRNIAGEDRTFEPDSDFDVDFDFSVE